MTIRALSKIFAAGAVALALTAAGAARAETFEFKFTGDGVSADIFANAPGVGSKITSIYGSLTDANVGPGTFVVTGLSPYASSDNDIGAAAPWVTWSGLSFATDTGGSFNLFDNNGTYQVLTSVFNPGGNANGAGYSNVVLTVSAVPEPGALALMVAGLLGVFGLSRRRQPR
jgi:hypothetical protein